jgi:hypothetical protein
MAVEIVFNPNGEDPEKPKTLRRSPHDWAAIEQYYVQDESLPSYRGIARQFGISLSSVIKHANADDWQKKRESYWANVQQEVFDKVKIFQVANRVQRFKSVSATVNKVIKQLGTKGKIREATVQDLAKLLDIEAHLLRGAIGQDGVSEETMAEIVEAQIIRIRKISGDRRDNLDQLLNSGLRRLGLFEGEAAGDGSGPQRQGVRVRPAPP